MTALVSVDAIVYQASKAGDVSVDPTKKGQGFAALVEERLGIRCFGALAVKSKGPRECPKTSKASRFNEQLLVRSRSFESFTPKVPT